MLPILDYIKLGAGFVAGGVVAAVYVMVIHDPITRHAAKAEAVEQCKSEKAEMVSRATLDAMAEILAQERRYRDAATIAYADAQKRSGEALRAKEDAENRLAAMQEDAKGLPTWTQEEIDWLKRH